MNDKPLVSKELIQSSKRQNVFTLVKSKLFKFGILDVQIYRVSNFNFNL